MYLKFLNAPAGVRTAYALAKDSVSAYPKRAEREIPVVIDGKPEKMAITGSLNYATPGTAGNNGWIRRVVDGKVEVTWLLFDAGFDPRAKPMKFERCEGTSPVKNPVRDPRRGMAAELDRRAKCSATVLARNGGTAAVKGVTDAGDATAALVGDLSEVETPAAAE